MPHAVRVAVAALVLGLAGTVPTACSGDGGTTSTTEPPTTESSALDPNALPVLVADVVVPAGTEARAAYEQGLLRDDTVTRAQFPEDAVVSIELIDGMVAADDLPVGAIVTAGMFVSPEPAAPR